MRKEPWKKLTTTERASIWNGTDKTPDAFAYLHEVDAIRVMMRNRIEDAVLETFTWMHPQLEIDGELNALLNTCRLQADLVLETMERIRLRFAELGVQLERERNKKNRPPA